MPGIILDQCIHGRWLFTRVRGELSDMIAAAQYTSPERFLATDRDAMAKFGGFHEREAFRRTLLDHGPLEGSRKRGEELRVRPD